MEPRTETTPETLVTQLYRTLLQREPDPDGLSHYATALRLNRSSFTDLVLTFVDSAEFGALTGRNRPETRVSAHGCEFVLPTGITAAEIGSETYEPWVVPYFLETCRPGMTVLDIGASWGAFALPAARRVGETGRVWAIEVSTWNCQVLARSARASGLINLEILPVAVSDRLGSELMPHQTVTNNNCITTRLEVAADQIKGYDVIPVVPLDLLAPALGPVHVVKMDIEGMEHRTVRGGFNFFKTQRPIVFLEYSPQFQRDRSGADGRDLLSLFLDLGYGVEILHRTRPRETVPTADREGAITHIDGTWRVHCEQDHGTHLDLCLRAGA
jgi:FkbM family methyltransferase